MFMGILTVRYSAKNENLEINWSGKNVSKFESQHFIDVTTVGNILEVFVSPRRMSLPIRGLLARVLKDPCRSTQIHIIFLFFILEII